MVECPVCQVSYVANTLFCTECGLYLLDSEELSTDPLEMADVRWQGDGDGLQIKDKDLPDTGPLVVRLEIAANSATVEPSDLARELHVALVQPIRIGRMDPAQDIFPDVDLTDDHAMEHGVSRVHACIFRQEDVVAVEDLGSTNGTLLNGKRLAPYLPQRLKHGDQLQLGQLLIGVSVRAARSRALS